MGTVSYLPHRHQWELDEAPWYRCACGAIGSRKVRRGGKPPWPIVAIPECTVKLNAKIRANREEDRRYQGLDERDRDRERRQLEE